MKIYTKTGDNGETGLFGGERVNKDSLRIHAYGIVDELNSFLGLAICELQSPELKQDILYIQNLLFSVGSDLATPSNFDDSKYQIPRTEESFIKDLEKRIDFYSDKLEELKNFILPGGTKGAALLHISRTVCRRGERYVATLKNNEEINENILIFLNRLSDFLFVVARYENRYCETPDIKWEIIK